MLMIFASDPHGTGQPWINLIEQARQKYPTAQIVFGGDYIDGRSFSKETLEYVMRSVKHDHAIALLGNHEQMMIDFIEQGDSLWYANGAKTTVKSLLKRGYSKTRTRQLLTQSPYYRFIKELSLEYQCGRVEFVHAGINPDGSQTDKNYMLWAREEYWYGENRKPIFAHNMTDKVIVSGHTPTCLISGKFDGPHVDYPNGIMADTKTWHCPIVSVQYENEPARIFTDNGCHGDLPDHNGNILVINEFGSIVDAFN